MGQPAITMSALVSALTADQIQTAFTLEATDRAAKIEADQVAAAAREIAPTGALDYGKVDVAGLREEQKSQLSVVAAVVKAAGMKARLYEAVADQSGRYVAPNGYVKLSTGVIFQYGNPCENDFGDAGPLLRRFHNGCVYTSHGGEAGRCCGADSSRHRKPKISQLWSKLWSKAVLRQ